MVRVDERAPVIVSNQPGSWAWSVLTERHPAIIDRVRRHTPYPPEVQRALDELLVEIAGEIRALDPSEPGAGQWDLYVGRPWLDVPFLWAESCFYRKLLAAVGYFRPGPWQGIDPFGPIKGAELVRTDDQLDRLTSSDRGDRSLLEASLWGNRADLGFQLSTGGRGGDRVSGLLADDSDVLWNLLDSRPPGKICVVADNAGAELLPDLVLADHLLRSGRAASIGLHLKAYPYFISDATVADTLACLDRLAGRSAVGTRLREDVVQGRLVLVAHPFSCAPLPYREMPASLREEFAAATVTIMKGDLNYRRLVEDRLWPPTTPFDEVTAYFPGPVAALRTLKSDVVTGLDQPTVDTLTGTWRTSGRYALIQMRSWRSWRS